MKQKILERRIVKKDAKNRICLTKMGNEILDGNSIELTIYEDKIVLKKVKL
jgi:hypothetical protein